VIAEVLSSAEATWLITGLGVVGFCVGIAVGVKKLFFDKPSRFVLPFPVEITKQFATIESLAKLELDVQNQLTEMRTFVHKMIESADRGREGIHDRLNALVEVTFEMRGLIRGASEREQRQHGTNS
jgi:hypothetical protein